MRLFTNIIHNYRESIISITLITITAGYFLSNRNLSLLMTDMQLHAPSGEEYEYSATHNQPAMTNPVQIHPFNQSSSSIMLPTLVDEAFDLIPEWMQNYFKWHKEQRRNHMNATSTKFLVVVCLRDMKCGGVADRLKSLPYFIIVANRTRRVLLIKWEKLLLEDFQVPPPGGIDWRYPKDLLLGHHYKGNCKNCTGGGGHKRRYRQITFKRAGLDCQLYDCHDDKIRNSQVLLINSQNDKYEINRNHFISRTKPRGTFREIFQILFEPSPPLAKLINQTMTRLDLVPGKYLAAHLRMKYPKRFVKPIQRINTTSQDPNDLKMFRGWAESAINCVVHKAGTKNVPVYFSADNLRIISYILHQSRFASNATSPIRVVGIDHGHREDSEHPTWKGESSWDDHDPSEFYNVFLDWYILGNSKCASYGLGGYGLMGARLAGDACTIRHRVKWDSVKCPSVFDTIDQKIKPIVTQIETLTDAKGSHTSLIESLADVNAVKTVTSYVSPTVKEALIHVPDWMQNYFKWHAEQRQISDASTKYLVLVCLRKMSCGGAADRLRTLPDALFIAYKTNRVLLIKWEKLLLEDFQVPPPGGMDWRYPKDLLLGHHYKGNCKNRTGDEELFKRPRERFGLPEKHCQLYNCHDDKIRNSQVLLIKSQNDKYEKNRNHFISLTKPQGTFREIFQILFEPSPPLAKLINQTMTRLDLVPGKYLAAHLRMSYPKRFVKPIQFINATSQDPNDLKMFRGWAESAINCVVHKAGTKNVPVYFSADNLGIISYILHQSRFASNATSPIRVVGIDHGNREHSEHPTWKGESSWDEHDPSEFYNVFLDWYIIGYSKCVSHGLGGYGQMGARLAGDTCTIQHRVKWDSVNCPSVFKSTS